MVIKIILLTMILFLCSCAYHQPYYVYPYQYTPVYYAPPVIYQRPVVIYPQYYPY